MFCRGCSRLFLSCQFESFLLELQDRKKKTNSNIVVSFFFLSFCFGSCNTGAGIASKQSREPKKSTQNFTRIEISMAKVFFLRKSSFGSLYKQRQAKRMSCGGFINGLLYSYRRYIILHCLSKFSFSWALAEKICHSGWTISSRYPLCCREGNRIRRICAGLQSNHQPRSRSRSNSLLL